MKPFAKIIDTISSKEKLYTTPFLNFDYSPRTIARNKQRVNSDAIRKFLEKINERQEGAEKRKTELNKEALLRILTEEENKELAEIFTFLEGQKLHKERILEMEKRGAPAEHNFETPLDD